MYEELSLATSLLWRIWRWSDGYCGALRRPMAAPVVAAASSRSGQSLQTACEILFFSGEASCKEGQPLEPLGDRIRQAKKSRAQNFDMMNVLFWNESMSLNRSSPSSEQLTIGFFSNFHLFSIYDSWGVGTLEQLSSDPVIAKSHDVLRLLYII